MGASKMDVTYLINHFPDAPYNPFPQPDPPSPPPLDEHAYHPKHDNTSLSSAHTGASTSVVKNNTIAAQVDSPRTSITHHNHHRDHISPISNMRDSSLSVASTPSVTFCRRPSTPLTPIPPSTMRTASPTRCLDLFPYPPALAQTVSAGMSDISIARVNRDCERQPVIDKENATKEKFSTGPRKLRRKPSTALSDAEDAVMLTMGRKRTRSSATIDADVKANKEAYKTTGKFNVAVSDVDNGGMADKDAQNSYDEFDEAEADGSHEDEYSSDRTGLDSVCEEAAAPLYHGLGLLADAGRLLGNLQTMPNTVPDIVTVTTTANTTTHDTRTRRNNVETCEGTKRRSQKPKRFSCHCGRSFSKREHLKRHDQLVHRLERPYMCTVCEAYFGTKQNMQVHLTTRKHHFRLMARRASGENIENCKVDCIVDATEKKNASLK